MTTTNTDYGSNWGTPTTNTSKTNSSSSSSGTNKTTDEQKLSDATKGLGDNFNSFLKMLTTQMQNQDPLKPMDTNEMTQQLIQFSQIEQSIGTNSRLDKLLKLQGSTASSTNLAYLGRTVSFKGDSFDYTQGMTQAPLAYELASEAKSVRVDIIDDKGRTIRSMKGETAAGTKNIVNWDFKDDNGLPVQPGKYKLNVAPTGSKPDEIIKATPYTFGTVSGVSSNSSGETTFSIGSNDVLMSDITKVY